jgi:hypothetical protein
VNDDENIFGMWTRYGRKAIRLISTTTIYAFDAVVKRCVLEKAGFQYEGMLRQNAVKNGQVIDMKLYALIKN